MLISYWDQVRRSCAVHLVNTSTGALRTRKSWCCPSRNLLSLSSLVPSLSLRLWFLNLCVTCLWPSPLFTLLEIPSFLFSKFLWRSCLAKRKGNPTCFWCILSYRTMYEEAAGFTCGTTKLDSSGCEGAVPAFLSALFHTLLWTSPSFFEYDVSLCHLYLSIPCWKSCLFRFFQAPWRSH